MCFPGFDCVCVCVCGVCVCMYVCVCVCVWCVCMYVCVYVCVGVCGVFVFVCCKQHMSVPNEKHAAETSSAVQYLRLTRSNNGLSP